MLQESQITLYIASIRSYRLLGTKVRCIVGNLAEVKHYWIIDTYLILHNCIGSLQNVERIMSWRYKSRENDSLTNTWGKVFCILSSFWFVTVSLHMPFIGKSNLIKFWFHVRNKGMSFSKIPSIWSHLSWSCQILTILLTSSHIALQINIRSLMKMNLTQVILLLLG